MIPVSLPYIGNEEREAVLAVLDSGHLVQGVQVATLEALFCEHTKAKHAIAMNSGTAALHAALLAHGVGPGDEVITTPFTFIASVNAILFCGATPKFVDILPCCFNLDHAKIEAIVNSRTKAILPVHLYGLPAAMTEIQAIADRHGIAVIQDAAQAVGASIAEKQLGEFGTGCYSLYATKNVHCVEGGVVTTNDDTVAERCRLLRAHGSPKRYYHDILGYNYRLSDLHAAIAVPQMKRLPEIIAARRRNADYLNGHIRNPRIVTPKALAGCRSSANCASVGHAWHQYTIRVVDGNRDELVNRLTRAGVGSAVFYPLPAHRQKHVIDLGYGGGNLPNAEAAAREVISLPVHPLLTQNDLERIVEAANSL